MGTVPENSSPQNVTLCATAVVLLRFAALRIYHHAGFTCIAGHIKAMKSLLSSAVSIVVALQPLLSTRPLSRS